VRALMPSRPGRPGDRHIWVRLAGGRVDQGSQQPRPGASERVDAVEFAASRMRFADAIARVEVEHIRFYSGKLRGAETEFLPRLFSIRDEKCFLAHRRKKLLGGSTTSSWGVGTEVRENLRNWLQHSGLGYAGKRIARHNIVSSIL